MMNIEEENPLTASAVGLSLSDSSSPDLVLERQESTFSGSDALGPGSLNRILFPGGFSKRGEDIVNPAVVQFLSLPEQAASLIYVCDTVGDLIMIYFQDEAIRGQLNETTIAICGVRGWVVNNQNLRLLCPSFSENSLVFLDEAEIRSRVWTGYEFTPFVEGSSIRAFWNGTEWTLAAHRKIDARKSGIPGQAQGLIEMLKEAWPEFDEKFLQKDYVYFFVVTNQNNQIMNPEPVNKPLVYHLATISSSFCESGDNFEIVDCGGLQEAFRLPGASYLPKLTLNDVAEHFRRGKTVTARNGYDLLQIAPPRMAKLMEIRRLDSAPHVPPELMWLRLTPEERPLLVDAVPFHLKEAVSSVRMESYVAENIAKAVAFSVEALLAASGGAQYILSKPLNYMLKKAIPLGTLPSASEAAVFYGNYLLNLLTKDGASLYRIFRDVYAAKTKMAKVGVFQVDISDNEVFNGKKNNRPPPKNKKPRGREPKKTVGSNGRSPQVKGNVSFKKAKAKPVYTAPPKKTTVMNILDSIK